jgi:ribosomal protein S6--L-glutamate ligase
MYPSAAKLFKRQARRDLPTRRAASRFRIAVLAESRYLTQHQPAEVAVALAALGHTVEIVVPEDVALDIGGHHSLPVDGVVARGRSDHLLSVLRAIECGVGMPTINVSSAVAAVRDKASMGATLRAAGLPIPLTMLGTPARLSHHVPDEWYPLILKPIFGDNSAGLRLVVDRTELMHQTNAEVLVQPYLPTDGTELKLYVIGDEVWAVRRPVAFAPPGAARSVVRPARITVTPQLRALALRCGELFGLELYGVDCLTCPDGIVVLEVNDFPNYTDVPEASLAAARYITDRLQDAV